VVAVTVNQSGGPSASSEATPSKPAVFIQDNRRVYLVRVYKVCTCSKIRVVKVY
jgi:hypothetical protein